MSNFDRKYFDTRDEEQYQGRGKNNELPRHYWTSDVDNDQWSTSGSMRPFLTKKDWTVIQVVEQPENEIEFEFNRLASKWRQETGGYSTMIHIVGNDNYLDIIGMGKDVIPIILRDLAREPDYWFVALKHIAKTDPVKKEHLGDIDKMAQDWIDWGKANNYL